MKNKYTILGLFLTAIGCHENNPDCISGSVIGYEQCTNAVLIEVDNSPIGRELIFYDGSEHKNVVRAPGEPGQYGNSFIYFGFRPYKKDRDNGLFISSESPCLAVYAPFDVPTIVITGFSTTGCN